MDIFKIISNRIMALFDSEIRDVSRIIRTAPAGFIEGDATLKECDRLFVRRLDDNPKALKLSFWEDHFEWKALKEYPEIKGRLLDFGCGSGHSDIFLARNGMAVHGIDMSSLGIAIANHLRSREDSAVRDRLSFSLVDVTRDFSPKELFDAGWASHVFEHIAEPGPILKGLSRWLKPEACLLASVPLGHAYDDPDHVNHFPDAEHFAVYLQRYVHISRIDVCDEFKVLRALCVFKED